MSRTTETLTLAVGLLLLVLLSGVAIAQPAEPTTRPAPHCRVKDLSEGRTLEEGRAPVFDGLGSHTRTVTTTSPEAQRYFDQGLRLYYGFNHKEAARSFRAATRIDPDCAMGWWGVALAFGPNINAPMPEADVPTAWDAAQKARALAAGATEQERAFIDALATRYVAEAPADRAPLDRAYADAMRGVYERYPDDDDAAALFAEAVMDTMPWDYWEKDGTPKPATAEAIAALERVIARNPNHAGAHHFYIHAVEAGPTPRQALGSADALRDLAPRAGHLVHMPSHIYLRMGMYHAAARANEAAIAADEAYIAACRAQGTYPLGYYPHNQHFLWYARLMEGRGRDALASARKLVAQLTDEHVELGRLQPLVMFTHVRFADWDAALAEPKPDAKYPMAVAMWHYGRGVALANTGNPAAAREELDAIDAIISSDDGQKLEMPGFFGLSQIRIARHTVAGSIASAEGRHADAAAELRQAVGVQDDLPYMEPPYWYYPARHTLAEVLLRGGDPAGAEAVYRADLERNPANGWALSGLARSLESQRKPDQAAEVRRELNHAWVRADAGLVEDAAARSARAE